MAATTSPKGAPIQTIVHYQPDGNDGQRIKKVTLIFNGSCNPEEAQRTLHRILTANTTGR